MLTVTPTVLLEYLKLLLGYIGCCCYFRAHVSSCTLYGNASSVHESRMITTEASALMPVNFYYSAGVHKLLLGCIDCCYYLHAHVSSCTHYGNTSSVHESRFLQSPPRHQYLSVFDCASNQLHEQWPKQYFTNA